MGQEIIGLEWKAIKDRDESGERYVRTEKGNLRTANGLQKDNRINVEEDKGRQGQEPTIRDRDRLRWDKRE